MQPAPEPETPLRLDGLSVLVVDDTPQVATMIVAMLRRQGARGIPVASAPAALEALARERPDVLLADVAMPGENGFSMIRKIRALPRERGGDIPAAALTASDSDPASLIGAGFDIYLPKPFTLASLARTVAVLARSGAAISRRAPAEGDPSSLAFFLRVFAGDGPQGAANDL